MENYYVCCTLIYLHTRRFSFFLCSARVSKYLRTAIVCSVPPSPLRYLFLRTRFQYFHHVLQVGTARKVVFDEWG